MNEFYDQAEAERRELEYELRFEREILEPREDIPEDFSRHP
jgi:hypothetical protein